MSATDHRSRPPRRRARADRTRKDLVAAALALFAEKGIEAASVDEITDAAGVAKGTFYVHFRRKQDVLLEHASELIDTLDVTAAASTRPALDALCERLAGAFAGAAPALRVAMVRELLAHPARWAGVAGQPRTLVGVITPLLARGQDAGELRADHPSAQLARRLAVLLLDALGAAADPIDERALTGELTAAARLFLDGALAPSAPPRQARGPTPAR